MFRTGRISTLEMAEADRAEAWRQLAAPHFEVSGLPTTVIAEGRLLQMGALAFTDSVHPEQIFVRDQDRIRRDQADAVLCSVELDPGTRICSQGDLVGGEVGQVVFTDLRQPTRKIGAAGRTLCVSIQRDAFHERLKAPGAILDRPLGVWNTFLCEFMRTVQRTQSEITAASAGHLERSFLELVAACGASADAVEQSRGTRDVLLRRRAVDLMDRTLADPDLSPESIATVLQLSRSTLYRLFEGDGGVSAAVRERRLLRAQALLGNPIRRPTIQEVAYVTGFRSEAQFSRAFRRRFGMSPSEARSQAR